MRAAPPHRGQTDLPGQAHQSAVDSGADLVVDSGVKLGVDLGVDQQVAPVVQTAGMVLLVEVALVEMTAIAVSYTKDGRTTHHGTVTLAVSDGVRERVFSIKLKMR